MPLIGLYDIGGAFVRIPLALRLAFDDIQSRYKRTVLGPFWIALAQAGSIFGMTLVFSGLLGVDPNTFLLYVSAGIPLWQFFSNFLADMPGLFIQSKSWIESYEAPWTLHVLRRAFGYLIILFHQMITFVAAIIYLKKPLTVDALMFFPGLLVVFVTGCGVGLFLAVLGSRFRDLQPAMSVVAGFLFIFTPVFWDRASLKFNTFVVDFNPFYYYLEILRGPLLDRPVEPWYWTITISGAVVAVLAGVIAFSIGRKRLYHWM